MWRVLSAWAMPVLVGLASVGNLVLPARVQGLLGVDYLALCILGAGLLLLVRMRQRRVDHSALAVVGAVWLLFVLLGVSSGSLGGYGADKLLGFVVALVLIGAGLVDGDRLGFVRRTTIVVVCVAAAGAVATLLFAEVAAGGRISLFGLNPIGLARGATIAALVGLILVLAPKTRRWGTYIGLALVAVGLVAALATLSRGPLVGLVAGAGATAAALARCRGVQARGVALVGAGGVLATVAAASGALGPLDRLVSSDSSGRDLLWRQTLDVAVTHPSGVGWGLLGRHITGFESENGRLYPHNAVLEIAAEAGVVATAVFLVALLCCGIEAFRSLTTRSEWYELVPLALLVMSVTNAMFSSDLNGNRVMWLAMGLCLTQARAHFIQKKNQTVLVIG